MLTRHRNLKQIVEDALISKSQPALNDYLRWKIEDGISPNVIQFDLCMDSNIYVSVTTVRKWLKDAALAEESRDG